MEGNKENFRNEADSRNTCMYDSFASVLSTLQVNIPNSELEEINIKIADIDKQETNTHQVIDKRMLEIVSNVAEKYSLDVVTGIIYPDELAEAVDSDRQIILTRINQNGSGHDFHLNEEARKFEGNWKLTKEAEDELRFAANILGRNYIEITKK